MRIRPIQYFVAGALLAATAVIASPGARAEDSQSHMYCPVGSGEVCWIFGCWCEDSGLNHVASVDCTTLPAQQPWTWNAYVDVTSACPPPKPAASEQPKPTTP